MTHSIPLHEPRYSPTDLAELRKLLRVRATHAFMMLSLAESYTRRRMRKLPPGVTCGFNTDFVTDRLKDAGFVRREPPPLMKNQLMRLERSDAHRTLVKSDPSRGLSNYEQGKFLRATRIARALGTRAPDPRDFKGIRERLRA